jgi:hypothetical protein
MADFIGTSVTTRTLKRHQTGWNEWCAHVLTLQGGYNSLLDGHHDKPFVLVGVVTQGGRLD